MLQTNLVILVVVGHAFALEAMKFLNHSMLLVFFVKSNLKYTLMSAYLIGRIISYHPAEMRKDTQG